MSIGTIFWIVVIGGFFFWMIKKGGCGMGHGGHGGHGGHSGHGAGGGQEGHSGHGGGAQGGPGMMKDPVCGMFVDPKTSVSSRHMGQTLYFCSSTCKENFDKEPMKYMEKETKRGGGCCG